MTKITYDDVDKAVQLEAQRKRMNADGYVRGMGENQLRWLYEACLNEMSKIGASPPNTYIGKTPPREYEYDVSLSNPGLHELYVNTAMIHLKAINKMIKKVDRFSNVNMMDLQGALWDNRQKLIDENTAYRDAAARLMAGHRPEEEAFEHLDEAFFAEATEASIPDDADFYTILAARTKLSRPEVKLAITAIQYGMADPEIMKIVEPEMNKLIDERPDLFREKKSNDAE